MFIAFYLARETHLKTMGGLIQESINRGHDVTLFYELPGRFLGDKSYQVVNPDNLNELKVPAKNIVGVASFSEIVLGPFQNYVIVHEGFHTLNFNLADVARLRKVGTKVISLVHFFEISQWPIEALDHFDLTIYPSDYCLDLHFSLQCDSVLAEVDKRREKFMVAGSPMFDQLTTISREEARKHLGIDLNKKIVLLIAPVISANTPWRFHVWRPRSKMSRLRDAIKSRKYNFLWEILTGPTWREVVRGISIFCKRNSALLIIKSRGKQKNFPFYYALSDRVIDGFSDTYFPVFTTYCLLAASDLCITVNSLAASEAVAVGIPCVNIYVPHIDQTLTWSNSLIRYYDELIGGRPGTLLNYKGCVERVDRRKIVKWLNRKNLPALSVDPEERKRYMRDFLGIKDESASNRILDRLEELLT